MTCALKISFWIWVICAILIVITKVIAKILKSAKNCPNHENATISHQVCTNQPSQGNSVPSTCNLNSMLSNSNPLALVLRSWKELFLEFTHQDPQNTNSKCFTLKTLEVLKWLGRCSVYALSFIFYRISQCPIFFSLSLLYSPMRKWSHVNSIHTNLPISKSNQQWLSTWALSLVLLSLMASFTFSWIPQRCSAISSTFWFKWPIWGMELSQAHLKNSDIIQSQMGRVKWFCSWICYKRTQLGI